MMLYSILNKSMNQEIDSYLLWDSIHAHFNQFKLRKSKKEYIEIGGYCDDLREKEIKIYEKILQNKKFCRTPLVSLFEIMYECLDQKKIRASYQIAQLPIGLERKVYDFCRRFKNEKDFMNIKPHEWGILTFDIISHPIIHEFFEQYTVEDHTDYLQTYISYIPYDVLMCPWYFDKYGYTPLYRIKDNKNEMIRNIFYKYFGDVFIIPEKIKYYEHNAISPTLARFEDFFIS